MVSEVGKERFILNLCMQWSGIIIFSMFQGLKTLYVLGHNSKLHIICKITYAYICICALSKTLGRISYPNFVPFCKIYV